ncbi:hypothetical protein CXB51_034085 [Gossypium anomalum]|uniref:Uncharacterized protein n=1 Tax=Gossypium anomalum TaxID=47600 RepID=A0A8J5YB16_9ROSI|nr:hypothetical protein CXB51_034085 [Gossypium anomalum]
MAATRSNSFPCSSRQHPLATEVNEHLNRLRASKELPLSHNGLAHKSADELLDGSLRLLDLCNTAKDIVLKIGEAEIVSEVRKYISSRKVSKKTIHKALGNLKVIQRKNTVSPSETVSMLKEIEAVTCSMIEDLLSLISGPKP